MRKILILIFIITFILPLTACSFKFDSFNTDSEKMSAIYDEVIELLDNNNATGLKSLFSTKVNDDIDNLLDGCIKVNEYYKGEFVSRKSYGGLIVSSSKIDGLRTKEMNRTLVITTTSSIYYISIKYFAEHSLDPNEIGIVSLHILEHDDSKEEQFTGTLKWTPGVTIGEEGLNIEGI